MSFLTCKVIKNGCLCYWFLYWCILYLCCSCGRSFWLTTFFRDNIKRIIVIASADVDIITCTCTCTYLFSNIIKRNLVGLIAFFTFQIGYRWPPTSNWNQLYFRAKSLMSLNPSLPPFAPQRHKRSLKASFCWVSTHAFRICLVMGDSSLSFFLATSNGGKFSLLDAFLFCWPSVHCS